ncbi:MAG: hypothetical protein U0520_00330 [Candidatus Saccharimonadales bacterium]
MPTVEKANDGADKELHDLREAQALAATAVAGALVEFADTTANSGLPLVLDPELSRKIHHTGKVPEIQPADSVGQQKEHDVRCSELP